MYPALWRPVKRTSLGGPYDFATVSKTRNLSEHHRTKRGRKGWTEGTEPLHCPWEYLEPEREGKSEKF